MFLYDEGKNMIVWEVMKNFWVALQACSIVRSYISQSFQEKPQGLRRSVQKNQVEASKQMQQSGVLSYNLQVSRKQPLRLLEIMASKICLVTKEAKQVKKPRGCEVLAREARRRKLGRASQRKHLLYPSNDVQREVCTVSLKRHSSLNTVKIAVYLLGKESLN